MSPSTFFLGVTPPPAFTKRVRVWQAHLEHVISAPHVTVQAPQPSARAIWQAAAKCSAQRQAPFDIHLGRVSTFGEWVI